MTVSISPCSSVQVGGVFEGSVDSAAPKDFLEGFPSFPVDVLMAYDVREEGSHGNTDQGQHGFHSALEGHAAGKKLHIVYIDRTEKETVQKDAGNEGNDGGNIQDENGRMKVP